MIGSTVPDDVADLLGGPEAFPTVLPTHVTGETLSALLGIAGRSVRDYAMSGVVKKIGPNLYDLAPSVVGYCEQLRRNIERQTASSAAGEKRRLLKEQADKIALQNEQARGEMVRAADVRAEWSGILRDVRAAMLAVPSRIGSRLGALAPADVAIIEREVRDALTEISDVG